MWDGLEALRAELRRLPQDLTDDAIDIVNNAAEGAKAEIAAGYHRGKTGNLIAGLTIIQRAGFNKTVRELRNKAPHAWLWDHGSPLRHDTTVKANRERNTGAKWGKSAPPCTFIKGVIKWRAWMYDRLTEMLESHGVTVNRAA